MHQGGNRRSDLHERATVMPPRPRKPFDLATLKNLPDWAVIDDSVVATAIGLSEDSMRRLDERGEGCARTQLSDRRHGRMVGNLKAWLQKRTDTG